MQHGEGIHCHEKAWIPCCTEKVFIVMRRHGSSVVLRRYSQSWKGHDSSAVLRRYSQSWRSLWLCQLYWDSIHSHEACDFVSCTETVFTVMKKLVTLSVALRRYSLSLESWWLFQLSWEGIHSHKMNWIIKFTWTLIKIFIWLVPNKNLKDRATRFVLIFFSPSNTSSVPEPRA